MRAAGRRPANRQCFKVPNSDLCLEVRPAAITEWELTTPSLERGRAAVGTFREMIFFSNEPVYTEFIIIYQREYKSEQRW